VAAPGAETVVELIRHALILIEKDQPAVALPVLRKASAVAPDDATVRHYLGYALWRIGQADAAAVELERALDLAPGNTDTQYILGRIVASRAAALIESQKPAEAVPLLRRASDLAPNEPGIHHYLGYALWSSGKPDDAAVAFTKALELAPDNAYTMYFLGRIAASQGETSRAIELYESVVASGNPIYDTLQQIGKAYLREGKTQKALEATQRALQQQPLDGALHYQLGRIYLQLNRRGQAQDEFDTAKRLKAADQEAIRKLLALDLAIEDRKNSEVKQLRESCWLSQAKIQKYCYSSGARWVRADFTRRPFDHCNWLSGCCQVRSTASRT
jgi:Flp pilus assembly protein TadD